MAGSEVMELRRRTIVKSLVWRVIGVVWTWIGAYFIVLVVPPTQKNAPLIATLIVVYHHSTRMIMYYLYERYWTGVSWGKYDPRTSTFQPMSLKDKLMWILGTVIAIVSIFLLIVYIGPLVKK
ncbi:MAG: DUF2061 domain-containing protein [Sedimentisphaerales bacterium]|nr:DUF2061 domain-containing protein [Sedimentisphaerales bacterium]